MMNTEGALQEARQLRTKIQMDSRLRLEVMAALSRTFRENGERVSNDLLRSLVFAVPDELPGEGAAGKTAHAGNGSARLKKYAKDQMPDTPPNNTTIPPYPPAIRRDKDTTIPPYPPAIARRSSSSPERHASMRQKSAASSLRAGAGRLRTSAKKSLKSTKRSGKTK